MMEYKGYLANAEFDDNAQLLELDVTVLLPAALEQVITAKNAHNIRAQIVAELANGPTTPEGDQILHENGVYIIPDFLCNAGGVTVNYGYRAAFLCHARGIRPL